jgi:hypothetical protein
LEQKSAEVDCGGVLCQAFVSGCPNRETLVEVQIFKLANDWLMVIEADRPVSLESQSGNFGQGAARTWSSVGDAIMVTEKAYAVAFVMRMRLRNQDIMLMTDFVGIKTPLVINVGSSNSASKPTYKLRTIKSTAFNTFPSA